MNDPAFPWLEVQPSDFKVVRTSDAASPMCPLFRTPFTEEGSQKTEDENVYRGQRDPSVIRV